MFSSGRAGRARGWMRRTGSCRCWSSRAWSVARCLESTRTAMIPTRRPGSAHTTACSCPAAAPLASATSTSRQKGERTLLGPHSTTGPATTSAAETSSPSRPVATLMAAVCSSASTTTRVSHRMKLKLWNAGPLLGGAWPTRSCGRWSSRAHARGRSSQSMRTTCLVAVRWLSPRSSPGPCQAGPGVPSATRLRMGTSRVGQTCTRGRPRGPLSWHRPGRTW
mmetsp:Transcript_61527/g.170593  ORF Transcript_61527/g.170593 Transcript_61527/m.170593 type:complete len:222 (+) Transcript_61527:1254-1919(+)